MSSHILLAIVATIALFAPAWADDPAQAPIKTETNAIVLDPAEAPIDTEMKTILWLETRAAFARAHRRWRKHRAIRPRGRAADRTDPTIAEYRSASTNANVVAE